MDKRLVLNSSLLCLVCLLGLAGGFWLGRGTGLLLAAAGLYLLIGLAAFGFVRLALRRPGGTLSNVGPHKGTRRQQEEKAKAFIKEKTAQIAAPGYEEASIPSADGLRLHGYFIPGAPGETRCVLLAHGYGWRALQMADYALYYHKTHGFNILMPDARAHGQSEGRYTGMGWFEHFDILRWLAWLEEKIGPDTQVFMHGISMGGSTTLMVGGETPPACLKFLVEDCGYTDAYSEFCHQLQGRFHLPAVPLLPLANSMVRLLAGYDLRQASALAAVGKTRLPTLFVHGEADTFVPTRMVHTLYQQAACPHKELVTVPGAAHVEAFFKDEDGKIRKAVSRYIDAYMPAPHS